MYPKQELLGAKMVHGAAWVRSQDKANIELGNWNRSKRMPKSAFPLRINQAYRLPGTWTWRVLKFDVDEFQYRVLLAYKLEKQEFIAMLGLFVKDDTTVLCRVEHHGSHPGWHVHYQPGFSKQSGVIRGLGERKRNCDKTSGFNNALVQGFEDWAISVSIGIFGIPQTQSDTEHLL